MRLVDCFSCIHGNKSIQITRVAEVGSLSARAKMTIKFFDKRVFTIFATNAYYLHINANLQI